MWHWDQGHLAYFQFDALRSISQFLLVHDLRHTDRSTISAATGLSFAAPVTHTPWRQYSRVFKSCLLLSEHNNAAHPTAIAQILAQPGFITCDEYLHFLVEASTEPSTALDSWSPDANFRYPLLFSLKYLLVKAAVEANPSASLDEIIGAYRHSGFRGDESETAFLGLIGSSVLFAPLGKSAPEALRRQARESLRVLCQISYLHLERANVFINLDKLDAIEVFADLNPIGGPRANDRDAEIRRLANLFAAGSTHDFFSFTNTVVNEVVESGFQEGTKVEKTHVTIERNAGLRRAFFAANPSTVCDVCTIDTHRSYPWADRVMDLHHLLPLCSGTRVEGGGTTFSDLVPLCPSCHRAVHRYYGVWFRQQGARDFSSREEAVGVYGQLKKQFPGLIHA